MGKTKAKREIEESLLTPEEQDDVAAGLPADLPDLGTIDGVGRKPFSFGVSPLAWWITSPLYILFGILLFVGMSQNPPEKPAVGVVATIFAIVFIVFGVLGLGLAAFLASRHWVRRGEQWIFFRRAIVRLNWGKPTIIPWRDLQLRKTRAAASDTRYEITGHEGKPITFRYSLFGSRVLILAMQGRHAEMLLPAMKKQIEEKQPVTFGKVTVTADGFSTRRSRPRGPRSRSSSST